MEEYKYVPNVNPEEKEVSKKDLEVLSEELNSLNEKLDAIKNIYNKYLFLFPDDKDFLNEMKIFRLKVLEKIEKIKMEIVKKVASVSNYSGAN